MTTTIKLFDGDFGNDTMVLRCNLSQAASPVQWHSGDGDWQPSPYQCADCRHSVEGLVLVGKQIAATQLELAEVNCDYVLLPREEMMSKLTTQIQNAIDRSISHNEIVHLTIDGDSGDALEAIHSVFDGETDYAMIDYEGVDTMDVWGWTEETRKDEQDWRLAIRFRGQ